MTEQAILDIAHVSFLGMIESSIRQSGTSSTKGTLMRMALKAADQQEPVEFATFEDFARAAESGGTPIARVEGRSASIGAGVFGLPVCPFAASISNYKEVFGGLPESFKDMTDEYNKEGRITDKYRVGSGAGVSPFCAVHQPLRSALGEKITIGGKPVAIYQLGCKSGSGYKGLAHKWIEAVGASQEQVNTVLDDNMCCYAVCVVD